MTEIRLKGYSIKDTLDECDPKTGKPSIISAYTETGSPVIIKHWLRDPTIDDADIREIWLHEVRQLHRLSCVNGTDDLIVPLLETVDEKSGFYVVLDSQTHCPLASIDSNAKTSSRTLMLPERNNERERLLGWGNLKRIARGLDVLHSQGILHRNLTAWSVFTSCSDSPDFQLSGFEFSLRLSSKYDNQEERKLQTELPGPYSFREDWRAFGLLAAEVLKIEPRIVTAGVKNLDFTPIEHKLLHSLLSPKQLTKLDAATVCDQIDSIVEHYNNLKTGRSGGFYFVCDPGRWGEKIKLLDGYSSTWDLDNKLQAIETDLQEALFTVVRPKDDEYSKWILVGRQLMYELDSYSYRGSKVPQIMRCRYIGVSDLSKIHVLDKQILSQYQIKVSSFQKAEDSLTRIRRNFESWEILTMNTDTTNFDEYPILWSSIVLLQQLQAVVATTKIWPIRIENSKSMDSGMYQVTIVARHDESRTRLFDAVGLESPAECMRASLGREHLEAESDWVLSRTGALGAATSDSSSGKWSLIEDFDIGSHSERYILESDQPPPNDKEIFIRAYDYIGSESLLKRQIKGLANLRENKALLNSLSNLQRATIHSQDEVGEIDQKLDISKKTVLEQILSVIPIYLLQGPPGVGKTYLIGEMVRNRFNQEPSTQMLLSAQNHDTVDHLLGEVTAKMNGDVLVVRTESKNRRTRHREFTLRHQSKNLINQFSQSEMMSELPQVIRNRVQHDNNSSEACREESIFQDILLRSANLLFSTTNAKELEELIDDRHQFDWSIMEEAGRATAPELIAPLLLSHRRLLIGDHKQLPPFDVDRCLKLLKDSEGILSALKVGDEFISRLFRGLVVPKWDENIDFGVYCDEAGRMLTLFESLFNEQWSESMHEGCKITAGRLDYQHRMHPTIAELVSETFYDKNLKTHDDCIKRFEEPPPFSITDSNILPPSPIIIIDMPYQQSTRKLTDEECSPNYHNPNEVLAILDVLRHLRAEKIGSKPTSLAILAPYKEQTKKLRAAIGREMKGSLKHIKDFEWPTTDSAVSTIDGFQGNEADIVVASFVRNNHHSSLGQCFGFLRDPRRFNVLISRAKWKFILVCSLEFIESRIRTLGNNAEEINFLKQAISKVRNFTQQSDSAGVPLASIVPVSKIQQKRIMDKEK